MLCLFKGHNETAGKNYQNIPKIAQFFLYFRVVINYQSLREM